MKIAVLCSFVIFLSVQFCSAQRRTNIDWNGINHQRGRHNTNVNVKGIDYNYGGKKWNTNVNHNVWNGNTGLNANYRKNHNFNVGHNARNRQTNLGYNYRQNHNFNVGHNANNRQTNLGYNYRQNHNFNVGHNTKNRQTNFGYKWNFGKRRRSIEATGEIDLFKPEKYPKAFLKKLALLVNKFVQDHKATVPELEILSVFDNNEMTSNVTVAKVVVCLVRKLQRILPKTLGNFIVKMIKFHGPSFNINNLSDFFHVDAAEDEEGNVHFENEKTCELSKLKGEVEPIQIESGELLEIKKFVASLVKVGMEYQLLQEKK